MIRVAAALGLAKAAGGCYPMALYGGVGSVVPDDASYEQGPTDAGRDASYEQGPTDAGTDGGRDMR